MTPAAQVIAAIILIGEIDTVPRPADAIISAWSRSQRGLDDRDRGAVLELVNGVLRHRARLGWWLERFGRDDTPRGRVLAWLMLAEGKTPEQVRRLFNATRYEDEALNEREFALLIKLQRGALTDPDMPDDVRLECPDWAAEPLRQRFGEAFEAEMTALLTPPSLDLRVNTLKASRPDMLRELTALGLKAHGTPMAPQGIRLKERLSLSRLPGLKTGEIEIQDEGSQLVAQLLDARPGDRVVDFCAGAGGKTLAIAAQMNNKGRIIACDINEARLKRGAERMRHAGVHNAETKLLSSETDRWIKRHKASFDRVLVDAPCSGTGTWRRNPDARWRAPEEKGLPSLIALQARILASAARLVKPGGRLVYATCSLLAQENEEQVATFLAATPGFRLVPLAQALPGLKGPLGSDFLSLTPAQHDTDGFFAAVIERDQSAEPAPLGE